MADRPIIFSAPMVRALLDGRKTQTRRVLKPQPPAGAKFFAWDIGSAGAFSSFITTDKRGNVDLHPARLPAWRGDRLWVRETFQTGIWQGQDVQVTYRATMDWPWDGPWRSPIFMPRKLSRLTLTVTDVRVERLQEIKGRDIIAEGVRCEGCHDVGTGDYSACREGGCWEVREVFHKLWNSLHGPDAWDANPWVVVLTFTVQRGNIDQFEGDA